MKVTPISAIITHPVLTINVHSTLEEAEKLMRRQKIRYLPVVKSQRLVGIITTTDLICYFWKKWRNQNLPKIKIRAPVFIKKTGAPILTYSQYQMAVKYIYQQKLQPVFLCAIFTSLFRCKPIL